MKYIFLPLLVLLSLSACTKVENQSEIDENKILKYIEENQLQATKDPSGLYYVILDEGTGEHPVYNSTVEVKYKGMLLNKTVFDRTEDGKTFTYALNGLIQGWQIGIPLIKKGGKEILLVPSGLGYGNYGVGNIPPNSVLIFEIELVDF